MKKLIILIFSLSFIASAQTKQGQFIMIGETNFTSDTNNGTINFLVDGSQPEGWEADQGTSTTITGAVKFGYLVTKNIAIGLMGTYQSFSIDYNDSDFDNPDPTNTTSFGAFSRFYVGGIAFIEGNYSMLNSSEWDDLDPDYKPSISVVNAGVGFSLFLSKNVAFTPSFGYAITQTTLDDGDTNVKTQNGNLIMKAGIEIYL